MNGCSLKPLWWFLPSQLQFAESSLVDTVGVVQCVDDCIEHIVIWCSDAVLYSSSDGPWHQPSAYADSILSSGDNEDDDDDGL